MHLMATRDDLGTFAHVHTVPTEQAGRLAVDLELPTEGRYLVNTEFRRQGSDAPIPPVPGPRSAVVDGVRVAMSGWARGGETSELRFTFADPATGEPISDQQPAWPQPDTSW